MKQIFRAFAIFPILILLSATAFSQQLKKGKTLSPEDLGIQKYIFQCTPKDGYLVVFRTDEYADAHLVSSYVVVTKTLSKKTDTETLLLIHSQRLKDLVAGHPRQPNVNYSPSEKRVSYILQTKYDSEALRNVAIKLISLDRKCEFKIVFENPKTHLAKTFIYTMTSERYEDVEKQYHAKLPKLGKMNGWLCILKSYQDSEK